MIMVVPAFIVKFFGSVNAYSNLDIQFVEQRCPFRINESCVGLNGEEHFYRRVDYRLEDVDCVLEKFFRGQERLTAMKRDKRFGNVFLQAVTTYSHGQICDR